SFEVDVNGQTQTVESNGIEISGAQQGTDYTITVTPIGQKGANEGVRGESRSTTVQVPSSEDNSEEMEDENGETDEEVNEQENEENVNENEENESDEEIRSEEHTSELQSRFDLVCRLLLEK